MERANFISKHTHTHVRTLKQNDGSNIQELIVITSSISEDNNKPFKQHL